MPVDDLPYFRVSFALSGYTVHITGIIFDRNERVKRQSTPLLREFKQKTNEDWMALPDQVFSQPVVYNLARLELQTKHSLSLFSRGETLFFVIQIKKNRKQEDQAIDYQPSAS
jgi:hypothetical protein